MQIGLYKLAKSYKGYKTRSPWAAGVKASAVNTLSLGLSSPASYIPALALSSLVRRVELTYPLAVVGGALGSMLLQHNQNKLITSLGAHKKIKTRPLPASLGFMLGGFQGYGIQKRTNKIYNEGNK